MNTFECIYCPWTSDSESWKNGATEHWIENHSQERTYGNKGKEGPENASWRGDDAAYETVHTRLRRAFGRPQECEFCGTTDPSVTFEWALMWREARNLIGIPGERPYSIDMNDYTRLCQPCHKTYDHPERYLNWSREGRRLLQRRWRERVRSQETPDHVHGTAHGYRSYSCRCAKCTAANTQAMREYKRRKRDDTFA